MRNVFILVFVISHLFGFWGIKRRAVGKKLGCVRFPTARRVVIVADSVCCCNTLIYTKFGGL